MQAPGAGISGAAGDGRSAAVGWPWRALLFRWLPIPLILLSIALFAVETASLRGFVSGDFDIFRMAAQRVLDDPHHLYRQEGGALEAARALMGYIYPPPSIVLFLPLALMERAEAYALAGGAALVATVVAQVWWLRLLSRSEGVRPGLALSVCVVAMSLVTGAVYSCRAGRIDTIVLLVMVAAVALSERARARSQFGGGVLLAVGSWIKIYPALLVLPRLRDSDGRGPFLGGFAAGAVLVPILGVFFLPPLVWFEFFLVMLPEMGERTIVNIDNQSLSAIAGRLIAPRAIAIDNSFAAIVVPPAIRWGVVAGALAALVLITRAVRSAGRSRLVTAGIIMALTSLIAPLGWGHSYAYALPLFAAVLVQAFDRQALGWIVAIGFGWALQVIPAHNILPALEEAGPVWHLYYARYAIGTLIFITAQLCFLVPSSRAANHGAAVEALPRRD